MSTDEERILWKFQETGSRDALHELLIAHQHRIYNVCFQVLGQAEDAEDAMQETLMKLASGARSARNADALRGWIYRVSLRVALDAWRHREATRRLKLRFAMNRPDSTPFDDREHLALFEAMDRLGDAERALLLEHYFDKVSLADLGARRGVSAVAIWKRVDWAREKLKRMLLGAGFVAASARVGETLESAVPASLPAAEVGEEILTQALLGGVAVSASKNSTIALAVTILVALMGISIGGYLLMHTRTSGGSPKRAESTVDRKSEPPTAPPESVAGPSGLIGNLDSSPGDAAEPNRALRDMLERYRVWHAEYQVLLNIELPPDNLDRNLKARMEGWKRFKDARALIFEDPAIFLGLIRDPANEELMDTFIEDALCKMIDMGRNSSGMDAQYYSEFPPALMEGLIDLARSGPRSLQLPILRFLGTVHEVPDTFDTLYEQLIHHPDPAIQAAALDALWRLRSLDLEVLEKIRIRFDTSADYGVRSRAILAISWSSRPEVFPWMLERFETNSDPQLTVFLAEAAVRTSLKVAPKAESLERLVRGLIRAIGDKTEEWERVRLLATTLELPVAHSVQVLEATLYQISDEKLRKAVENVLKQARGEAITPNQLQSTFRQEMRNP